MNRIDDDLRALPARDAPLATAARVRSSALRAFDAAHGTPAARAKLTIRRAWSNVGVPALLFAFVCLYLSWTLEVVAALYR